MPACGRGLVLQIHDELLFEGPEDEAEAAAELVRNEMVAAFDLDPPLVVRGRDRARLARGQVGARPRPLRLTGAAPPDDQRTAIAVR